MSGSASNVVHRQAGPGESAAANRAWWDAAAAGYYAEHGDFLGDVDLLWCPEGVRESKAQLLGNPADLARADVLEVGCGAGQGGRWVASQGARIVALDLSCAQLLLSRVLDTQTGVHVPVVQADAQRIPFLDEQFDVAFSAFGGIPFVADSAGAMREVARVLRDGGRFVFAVPHPFRWAFPDDPGPDGLTLAQSYFDRTPYVEQDAGGAAVYVEHHRTIGDRVRELLAAGLVLDDVLEPEWPAGHDRSWGQWGPLRGALMPGTAIFCAHKPL